VNTADDDGTNYLYGLMRGRYPDHPPRGVIDLGHDVLVEFTVNGDGTRVGLLETHRAPDGSECAGSVTFDVPQARAKGPRWTVHSLDPLHLEPSILCSCGHHGFIREGRWVPV
jgi:hypothetical protein